MAARAIIRTVLPSARPAMPTTATTERQLSPVVRVTPVVLITPIVRPKSAPGLVTQAIQNPEALVQKYLATYVRPVTANLTDAVVLTDLRQPERKPEAFVQNVVLRRKIPMVISA